MKREGREWSAGVMRDLALDLMELVHFASIGEAWPVRFEWWWARFRPDLKHQAACRAWERLKATLREVKVTFELVDEETGEPWVPGGPAGAAIKLDLKATRRRAERLRAVADRLTPEVAESMDMFAGLCGCGRPVQADEPESGEACDTCAAGYIAAATAQKVEMRRAMMAFAEEAA